MSSAWNAYFAFGLTVVTTEILGVRHVKFGTETDHTLLSLSRACFLFLPVAPNLEQRASVKRFVSLQFLNPRSPWTGDPPNARQLHKQTYMPWVGFEPTIPAFERAKTVHALDRAATVIGRHITHALTNSVLIKFLSQQWKYGDGANLCCWARQSSSQ
jgi:hypothetical protein